MSHKSAALICFAAEAWNHAYFWIVMYIETGTDRDGTCGGERYDGHLATGFKVKNKRHAMKSNIGMETTYGVFSSSAGDGNEFAIFTLPQPVNKKYDVSSFNDGWEI